MDTTEFLQISLTIIGSGSLIAIYIQYRYQKLLVLEGKLRDERRKVYLDVLKPFIISFKKNPDPEELTKLLNSDEFRTATVDLNLIGSDDVIRAYGNLMQYTFKSKTRNQNLSESDAKKATLSLLNLVGRLFLAIRKDLGNDKTLLKEIDMFRYLITDIEKYEEGNGIVESNTQSKKKWGDIILFYVILVISFVGLYILIQSISGFSDPTLNDVVLAIGGGVLGGLCYALFQKAFMDR